MQNQTPTATLRTTYRCRYAVAIVAGAVTAGLAGCGNPTPPPAQAQQTQSQQQPTVSTATVSSGNYTAETFLPTYPANGLPIVRARTNAKDDDTIRDLTLLIGQAHGFTASIWNVHFYPENAPAPPTSANEDGTLDEAFERWIIARGFHHASIGQTTIVSGLSLSILTVPVDEIVAGQSVRIFVKPLGFLLNQPPDKAVYQYVIAMDDPEDMEARQAIADHYAALHPASLMLTIHFLPKSARWDEYPFAHAGLYRQLTGHFTRSKDGELLWYEPVVRR